MKRVEDSQSSVVLILLSVGFKLSDYLFFALSSCLDCWYVQNEYINMIRPFKSKECKATESEAFCPHGADPAEQCRGALQCRWQQLVLGHRHSGANHCDTSRATYDRQARIHPSRIRLEAMQSRSYSFSPGSRVAWATQHPRRTQTHTHTMHIEARPSCSKRHKSIRFTPIICSVYGADKQAHTRSTKVVQFQSFIVGFYYFPLFVILL